MKTIFNPFGAVGVDLAPGLCQDLLPGVTVSLVEPPLAARSCLPGGLAAIAVRTRDVWSGAA
jgi:hypothetical protein